MLILSHLTSPIVSEETLIEKVTEYLKQNNFDHYQSNPEYDLGDVIYVWLPDIGTPNHPQAEEDIRKLSDLASFLFDTLKIAKRCLHFVYKQVIINGAGESEYRFTLIDPINFEELTGKKLPVKLEI